jgi:plasmid stability protein
MPRTTLDIDGSDLRDLRERANAEGKSMGQLASELLARSVAGEERAEPAPIGWTSRDLGTPLVDLEDKEALRAALDRAP